MTSVFNIIGLVLLALVFICLAALLVVGLHFWLWFHCRSCKHCHHTLEHKGLQEDADGDYYLFHCPHCGAWEKVPRDEFFCDFEKGCNSSDFQV